MHRGCGFGVGAAVLFALFTLTACGGAPKAPNRAELQRIRAEGQALQASADRLETRMLADQARVHLWQVLARRHRHVSALATVNADMHFHGMLKWLKSQDRRWQALHHTRATGLEHTRSARSSRRRRRPRRHARHRR